MHAAEDLAQQTLIEAWRLREWLSLPESHQSWLFGIARNMCRRWARTAARDQAHLIDHIEGLESRESTNAVVERVAADSGDIELELEQADVAELLNRALASLPPETRDALVLRYVEECPQTEVAARLGMTEGSVEARLHRGRLALRRILSTSLREEAVALGLVDTRDAGWQETHIWCPCCGQRRMLIRLEPPPGVISFRCPSCDPEPGVHASDFRLANRHFAALLGGYRQPRAILRRVSDWSHTYYRGALEHGRASCSHCGRPVQLRRTMRESAIAHADPEPVLIVVCEACGEGTSSSLSGLLQSHPAVQAFWWAHERIRILPHAEIEVDARPALVSRVESVGRTASLDIISARDTFTVLAMHSSPDPALV